MMSGTEPNLEMILPEDAERILMPRILALQDDGWRVLSRTSYQARLTRDDKNLNLYIDLVGQLVEEERPLTPRQQYAQQFAIALFFFIFMTVFLLASWYGWLD